ncbi:helix-turn-helix domain-containing protein [Guptibacillus hwajinpoensis]|uniref:XRE family transcriptional regulator of biofilm formation n=1 Tax=Guptibacillus hwajinpoensis TaxID=208199 RepID=A0ABU0JZL2_9BACL|nr:helix-turn-helix transcriptional regulator [Alkalihalobacillus hemicentroti]MDQ0482535.1 XRE family transcriptional regulator of biofilm formation [Alkalihalobacillus hemicentroti]
MIGENLRKYRKAQGISLTELAERSNVSKSYLNSLERNIKDNPSINLIDRIAKELDTDIYSLLGSSETNRAERYKDGGWGKFIEEAERAGIEGQHLSDYKELISFIKWKKEQV